MSKNVKELAPEITAAQKAKDEAKLAKANIKREKKLKNLDKHVAKIEAKYATINEKLRAKKEGLDEMKQADIDHKIGAMDRKRLADINTAYDKYAPKKAVKLPTMDKVYYTVIYIILALLLIIVLYPLIYILSSSFSSPTAVATGKVVFFPVSPSLEGYKTVFTNSDVWIGYRNTILYTLAGTVVNVIMTIICAYPLARKGLPGRGFFTFMFTFTMLFSGGLIPTYLLNKNLGLINNPLVMIIPGAMTVSNLIIARSFMQSSIPNDLLEASQIDGCSDIRYFFSCIIPLSSANIAVITLYYAVGHWNAYFNAFIYLSKRELFPLQVFLREILILSQVDSSEASTSTTSYGLSDLMKYALIVVATVPILCLYPFIQKFFTKGVMVGSLKG